MNKSGKSNPQPAKGKTAAAAVVSNNSRTLRKQKQAKRTVKLSFKSPLVHKSHVEPCGSESTKLILEQLSSVFCSRKDLPTEDKRYLRNLLIIGINAVTKAMESEQNSIKFVIICKEVTPQLLIEHLPIMACMKQIPCLIISCTSTRLGQCLGLPVATCFALVENLSDPEPMLQQCMQTLSQYGTIPKIPWLEKSTPSYNPPELDENCPKRGQKKNP